MKLVPQSARGRVVRFRSSVSEYDELLTDAALKYPVGELVGPFPLLEPPHMTAYLRTLGDELGSMFDRAVLIGRKIAIVRQSAEKSG